jgi:predicted nucleotidyltransferase component of viral defense system
MFYLSGGTCLSEYYLQHRLSEDLDFFCESEFESTDVTTWIAGSKLHLGFNSFEYQQSFNRNLYFLSYIDGYTLKVEFTYYPFRQIEKPKKREGILIDSMVDIAANKLFTMYQKPRGRDYFDLFMILNMQPRAILDLRILSQTKFDSSIDLLQLATRMSEVSNHLDDPILANGDHDRKRVMQFFMKESTKLKKSILA